MAAEIYYFKPVSIHGLCIQYATSRRQQTVGVSLMFLAIISYVLGFAMETFIPRHGLFHFLNPVSSNFITFLLSHSSPAPFQQKGKCFYRHYG